MQQRDEPRYQHLKKIADLLACAEFTDESREAYALARKFRDRADVLGAAASNIHAPN